MSLFSFARNKKVVDAQPFIRRILDLTAPNRLRQNKSRSEVRNFRSLDIAFCPFAEKVVRNDLSCIGFTRDLRDRGASFVTTVDVNCAEIILCFFFDKFVSDHPFYFRAIVRRKRELLFNMVEYGVEIVEYFDANTRDDLKALGEFATESLQALNTKLDRY